jgi:ABC-type transporter Mla subunit MlaD
MPGVVPASAPLRRVCAVGGTAAPFLEVVLVGSPHEPHQHPPGTERQGAVPEERASFVGRVSVEHERAAADAEPVPRELGERVQTGFQDLSRLLGAIKETLQGRDGQVQQTLQALPGFLQQVPRIHRAEIECLAQISKQLEHMGSGTRDVVARLDGLPDLLRTLTVGQAQQAQFLEGLQARFSEALDVQSRAIQQGLEQSRQAAEGQLGMIRSLAATQEDIFATFQNTQNRALNVFHRAQQQSNAQHRETQTVTNRQVEMLVEKVHSAQTRVFWLSIGFAALAAAGMIAALIL